MFKKTKQDPNTGNNCVALPVLVVLDANGSDRLGRYDFLLVFCSDLKSL